MSTVIEVRPTALSIDQKWLSDWCRPKWHMRDFSECVILRKLLNWPLNVKNSIYKLTSLDGQFWPMRRTLSLCSNVTLQARCS